MTSPGPAQPEARVQDQTARPAPSGSWAAAKSQTLTARYAPARSSPSRQASGAQAARASGPVASRGWRAGAAAGPSGSGV